MTGIFHNKDLDGFTSGAIIKYKYPLAKLIGHDYPQKFDFSELIPGDQVIMADISLPMDQMRRIAEISDNKFTWIDHHLSAITDYQEDTKCTGPFCDSVLGIGTAACELTWKYLFPDTIVPEAVKLLSMYDTWQNSDKELWENRILPFQFGMRLHCDGPSTFPKELFKDNQMVNQIINEGDIV